MDAIEKTLEKKNEVVIWICGAGLGYVLFKVVTFISQCVIDPAVVYAFKILGI